MTAYERNTHSEFKISTNVLIKLNLSKIILKSILASYIMKDWKAFLEF